MPQTGEECQAESGLEIHLAMITGPLFRSVLWRDLVKGDWTCPGRKASDRLGR